MNKSFKSLLGIVFGNVFIYGIVVIVIGLLIALGPQYLFKLCPAHEGSFPLCHWSGRAEIGMGFLIVALGICTMVFPNPKTFQGLVVGIFLAGIIVLSIPHALIGGCGSMAMACRRVAFPALTIEGVILLVYSALVAVYVEIKDQSVVSA